MRLLELWLNPGCDEFCGYMCCNQNPAKFWWCHNDVIMSAMASQITSLTIVYSTVYSDADQRKHQSSASLAFVRGIHRAPVNSPHKWPVTRKMFPFDDVIMLISMGPSQLRQIVTKNWIAILKYMLYFTQLQINTRQWQKCYSDVWWPQNHLTQTIIYEIFSGILTQNS